MTFAEGSPLPARSNDSRRFSIAAGTHATVEPATITIAHLPEKHFVTLEVLNLEGAETIKDRSKRSIS